MFIFTILLKDYDKHSGNYMFIEGRDTINLAPLLDNGLIFIVLKLFPYQQALEIEIAT